MCKSKNNEPVFNSLLDVAEIAHDEQKCRQLFAVWRWRGNVVCPHCQHDKVYTFKDGEYYKCAKCRKKFTVKVGTVFEGSNVKLGKWLLAIYLITSHKKGLSSCQLAKDIKVTQKTAWFILHRVRLIVRTKSFNKPLEDTIEVDETYVGGKEKNKHQSKRTKNTQGRSNKTKAPVFGMVQRQGELRVTQVDDVKKGTLQPIIGENVKAGSNVMSDEWHGYRGLHKNFKHSIIKHNEKQYVDGVIHTNTIEGFWSHFKRGINGIYHHISKEHLQAYLNEYEFRYNTRKLNEEQRMGIAVTNSEGERLKYQDLLKWINRSMLTPVIR